MKDCRAYLWRDSRFRLLTRDHSVIQDLVERGQITPAEAESLSVPMLTEDRQLLCFNGLLRCVYEDAMSTILAKTKTPHDVWHSLLSEAMEAGAPDNVGHR